jgi:hypothetical protein
MSYILFGGARLKYALVLTLATLIPPAVSGSVIDTRPFNSQFAYFASTGADAAGQTFLADANALASVTFQLRANGSGGSFRAVLLGTSGGIPIGPVLWQSGNTVIPGTMTDVTFTPNYAITAGKTYFIAVDAGVYTGGGAGSFNLGIRNNNPYANGSFYESINANGLIGDPAVDAAVRIVMNAVPEPSSFALLACGAGVLLVRRRFARS